MQQDLNVADVVHESKSICRNIRDAYLRTLENDKEIIPCALISVPYAKVIEESHLRFSPSQLDHLADLTSLSNLLGYRGFTIN